MHLSRSRPMMCSAMRCVQPGLRACPQPTSPSRIARPGRAVSSEYSQFADLGIRNHLRISGYLRNTPWREIWRGRCTDDGRYQPSQSGERHMSTSNLDTTLDTNLDSISLDQLDTAT